MAACESCCCATRENNRSVGIPHFEEYTSLQCLRNHAHDWKRSNEGKRVYPVTMIRRLVTSFVLDLRPPQLHMFLSEADSLLSTSPSVFLSPAERERSRKFFHRLHVAAGHVSKTSLSLLLQRRGCPGWMQRMVDQLQCESCLEGSVAQNAQRVSLATPPKLWQTVKVDVFELEDSQRKGFLSLTMDAACKLASCS